MQKYLLLLLLWMGFLQSNGQNISRGGFFGGAGIGFSNNANAEGLGINGTVGFQRAIWNDRLRIVPGISFGAYGNNSIDGVADAFFNSTNLQINLNFDLLKVKSLSILVGSGITANYFTGLIGTGGDPGRNSSEFFNEFNFAFNGLLGLKLNPEKNRIGYELLLLEGSFGNDFSEISVLKFRLTCKVFSSN